MSKLSEAIKKLAGGQTTCLNGEVKSVDKTEMTCEVGFGDDDSVVASLVCGDKKKGIVQIPKIGSNVIVVFYSPTVAFVVMVDEVDEILINGGENGGLVKIRELTDKVNELVDWCKNHKHTGVITAVSGGSGAPAVGTTGVSGAADSVPDKLNKDDYEDITIKH